MTQTNDTPNLDNKVVILLKALSYLKHECECLNFITCFVVDIGLGNMLITKYFIKKLTNIGRSRTIFELITLLHANS